MQDKHTPRYPLSKAAELAGISVNTLRSWYQRGHLRVGLGDKSSEGAGLARYVSAATVVAIAITAELVQMGISPKRAGDAAIKFAHTGDQKRNPGHTFQDGWTVLVFAADESWMGGTCRILNIDKNAPFAEVFNSYSYGKSNLRGVQILDVTFLVYRIYRLLHLDPYD